MHLSCKNCFTPLTTDLQSVPLASQNEAMGEDLLPPGQLVQKDGSSGPSEAGHFLTNTADAVHVKLTSDSRRLNGCCGLDGCDGLNLQCESCDAYVATKRTDCWMPHYIAFDPAATQVVGDEGA